MGRNISSVSGEEGAPPTHAQFIMGPVVASQNSPCIACAGVLLLSLLGLLILTIGVHATEPPTPLHIQADYLERRPAENQLRFQGAVDMQYGESRVFADVVEVNTETGDGTAEGNVRFEAPQQQITATRAEFNLFTRLGTLYEASGTIQGRSLAPRKGEAPQPVTFYLTAERFVRESEERFRIGRGSLTTCVGPDPTWQFKSRDASIDVEGYAHLSRATFWIKNVPVFYTPYFVYPTKTQRATGFLPPNFGTSERLGFFLDNRFFWAINEQSDSTIGVDYLSRRGIRPSLEYRYVMSAVDHGQFSGLFLDDEVTGTQFWKVSGTSQQTLPGQLRGILRLDLMNRDNYDRTFEVENLLMRTRRETDSVLSLIRNWQHVAVGLQTQRLEDVENRADERLTRYPDMALDLLPTPLPWAPLTIGLGALATNFRFDRTEPLGGDVDERRFNLQPLLAWTLAHRPWMAITPFLGLQETVLDLAGQGAEVQSVAIMGAEIRGPQLFRIYGGPDRPRYKHLVEPSLTYHWIPHFDEKTRRQPFDIFDDVFPRNDFMFSVTNRLYTRTATASGADETREFAFLRINQGLDLRGQRGEDLSLEARAQLTATLSLRADVAYDPEDGQLDIANAGLTLEPRPSWSLYVERRFRRDPNIDFINGGFGLNLSKGWSLTYSTGYNARDNSFAGNSVRALYRSQCWSLSLQMVQRPDETHIAFQIGLDTFLLPKVGF
jgi:LPS-assembly protein